MNYEWDEAKRASNIIKHNVDFADCVGALEDFAAITEEDDMLNYGEARYTTLGMGFDGRILYVVWTQRGENMIRIISARKASQNEARNYQPYFG